MWSLDSQQWAEVRDEMIRMLDQAPACHRFIWDLAPHYTAQHQATSRNLAIAQCPLNVYGTQSIWG